jgi:hypothetical protein
MSKTGKAKPAQATPSTESKLHHLERAHALGKLTKQEYTQKREEIEKAKPAESK